MISGTITVYTAVKGSVSKVVTRLSDGHYGLWEHMDDCDCFVWRGEFFRANLVVNRLMCRGTVS